MLLILDMKLGDIKSCDVITCIGNLYSKTMLHSVLIIYTTQNHIVSNS